ncbi:MAG TPA: protein kinase [Polyangiaceae bacterium]|nr:protein kinase [Polyangiaceae bacterium]
MATSTQVDAMGDTLTAVGSPAGTSASSSGENADSNSDASSGGTVGVTLDSGATTESTTRGVGTAPSARRDGDSEPSGALASEPASSTRSDCLSEDAILQYRQGELSRAELARIDEHLDGCEVCRDLIDFVIADEPEAVSSSAPMTTFQRGFLVADRYQIVRFVGRGGMGEVYSAIDRMTGRLVALKTVVCTAADDARAVRKLLDEVVNAQRVSHPNVFKIYDLHEHRDVRRGRVPFFTMEFVDGESLGARLRREKQLPLAEARAIALQLLSGLSAAHAKGVLHLDFKSDNVMLRRQGGEAVIMDFGLSRASDVQTRQQTSERLQAAGTLPYMSIEQLECRADLGPASDVYSFGVVLYEMLTGQLPFQGNTLSAVLLKQLRELPVPPSQHVPVSRPLEAFLLKCLLRSPAERYADATHALGVLDTISSWERPSPPSPQARVWRFAAFAGLLVGVALVLLALARRDSMQRAAASHATAAHAAAAREAAARPAVVVAGERATASGAVAPEAGATATVIESLRGDPMPASSGPEPVVSAPSAAPRRAREARVVPVAPAPPSETRVTPPPPPPQDATPSDWHGPPPNRIPRPRPL